MTRGGLPHSDISGSKLICSSPELFAACHVLHRLLAPRHSPYTLSSLTIRNSRTNAVCSLASSQRTYCDSSHATLRVGSQVRLPHMETVCCGRKKLPFAEYSVVKDQMGALPPCPRDQLGALCPRLGRSRGPFAPLRSLAGTGPLSDRSSQHSSREEHELRRPPKRCAACGFPSAVAADGTSSEQRAHDRDRRRCARRLKSLTHSPKTFQRARPKPKIGGEYRARTGDLLVANQALSQLS
jgi:hypothetical protein